MKRLYIVIAIICGVLSLSAKTQVRNTIFGVIVDENPNLRYINDSVGGAAVSPTTKVQTMTSVRYEASFGSYVANGIAIDVVKQYKNVAYGGTVATERSKRFGWANRAGLFLQCNTNAKAPIWGGVRAIGGYALSHIVTNMANGDNRYCREVATLKPYIGFGAIANLRLIPSCVVGATIGYRHSFVKKSDYTENVLSGDWATSGKKIYADRFSVGVSLSHTAVYQTQVSGDNCWLLEVIAGSSNLGPFEGLRFVNFKRKPSTNYGRVIGFGAEGYKDRGNTLSKISAMFGGRWLPCGASGHFAFEGGGMIGIGDYRQGKVSAKTEADAGRSLSLTDNMIAFGGDVRLYGEFFLFWRNFTIGGGVFWGPYSLSGNNFRGDRGFSGDEGKTFGFERGLYGKAGFAF